MAAVKKNTASRSSSKKKRRKKKKVNSMAFREAALFIVMALALILFISNFGIAGRIGTFLSALQFGTFGVLAYIFPVELVIGVILIMSHAKNSGVARVKYVAAFFASLFVGAFIEMISGGYKTIEKMADYYNFAQPVKRGGGVIGGAVCRLLTPAIGQVGAYIIIIVFIIIAVVIISERSILGGLKNGSKKVITSAQSDINEYRE